MSKVYIEGMPCLPHDCDNCYIKFYDYYTDRYYCPLIYPTKENNEDVTQYMIDCTRSPHCRLREEEL